MSVYENTNEKMCMYNFPPEVNSFLSKGTVMETKFALFISLNMIYNIIEQVRNIILDWSITLEENGIYGVNLTFTSEEKEKALRSNSIVSYTNNFYSEVRDSQIQMDTKNSGQSK